MRTRWIVITATVVFGSAEAGETMRCGRFLVDESASVAELLEKCGEPTSKRSEEADVRALGPTGAMIKVGTAITEYWTYDRGRQAAPIIVKLVQGKIDSMERGDR